MTLLSVKYEEFVGQPREWKLETVFLDPEATLVVGKNSTGKSRFLTVIRSLADSVAGVRPPTDGTFEIVVKLGSGSFQYQLEVSRRKIVREILHRDNRLLLNRVGDQPTQLLFHEKDEYISSRFPSEILAIASRQDELQHPWFVEFAAWAKKAKHYNFVGGFSSEHVLTIAEMLASLQDIDNAGWRGGNIVRTYAKAFNLYGKTFDETVLADMQSLGFPLSDVGTNTIQELIPELKVDGVMLFAKEEGVEAPIPQGLMSQGLFRTLALVVSINAQFFSNNGSLVIIDDVGEGLDFERSSALIKLLIEKSRKHSVQLLMASNDRFVMNGVPIDQWCVLQRKQTCVSAFTAKTHKEVFEDFKFAGLSNFDFFRTEAFAEVSPKE